MNIKIFIFNDAKSTIKGGGSNFLRKLDDYINKHRLRSSKFQDSDVILLNSFPFIAQYGLSLHFIGKIKTKDNSL